MYKGLTHETRISQIGHAVVTGRSPTLLPEGLGRTLRDCSMVRSWYLHSNWLERDKRQSGNLWRFPRGCQSSRGRLLRGI